MDYPLFNTLTKKVWSYDINPTAKGKPWTLTTGNSMMKPSSPYYYEPMQFGRTGFTDLAGWCLASVASAEGYDYMVIVMGLSLIHISTYSAGPIATNRPENRCGRP